MNELVSPCLCAHQTVRLLQPALCSFQALSLSTQDRQSQKYLIFFLALTGAQSVKMLCVHVHPGHYALVHSRSLLRSSREQASKPECRNASKPACEMLESIRVGAMPCRGLLRNIAGQFQTGCWLCWCQKKSQSRIFSCSMYSVQYNCRSFVWE